MESDNQYHQYLPGIVACEQFLKLPTVVQGKDNKSVFIASSLHSEGSF